VLIKQSLGALLENLDFAGMMDDEIKDICESKFLFTVVFVAR